MRDAGRLRPDFANRVVVGCHLDGLRNVPIAGSEHEVGIGGNGVVDGADLALRDEIHADIRRWSRCEDDLISICRSTFGNGSGTGRLGNPETWTARKDVDADAFAAGCSRRSGQAPDRR